MWLLWLRCDKANGPVVQEAGEVDVNLGFETIILVNLCNIEVLPLWITPFLKLFCWVFLKLTYHFGCQIQKLRVKLSQTSRDQIQTTTLALFKLLCGSSLLSCCVWLNCFIWIKAGFIRCNSLIIQELFSCFYGLLLLRVTCEEMR